MGAANSCCASDPTGNGSYKDPLARHMQTHTSTGTVLVVRSPSSPLATSMMLHANQLANVLRFEVASEAGAARLHWMRGVSKEWYKAATCMFTDGTWRAPLEILTVVFLEDIALLVRELDTDTTDVLYTKDTQQHCDLLGE